MPAALDVLSSGPLAWFRDWPNLDVPFVAAGAYTVWRGEEFIYAGMAGRTLTGDGIQQLRVAPRQAPSGLWDRLASHTAGRRSGDQFCVYVADLVLPMLSADDIGQVVNGTLKLDLLVRRYIHGRLAYRWLEAAEWSRGTARGSSDLQRRIVLWPSGIEPAIELEQAHMSQPCATLAAAANFAR